MSERTGYRDLIFNLWHRLIPYLKMIDLDFVQCCKYCSKPLLLCELTRQSGFKPTKILRMLAEAASIPAVLINYFPRATDKAFDKIHNQLLKQIYKLEGEIKAKSRQRIKAIAEMYDYCYKNHDPIRTYDAMIGLIGHQKIYPEKSKYEVTESTYPFKLAMEDYRYCNEKCEQADQKSRPNPIPQILIPKTTIFSSCDDEKRYSQQQPLLFDEKGNPHG